MRPTTAILSLFAAAAGLAMISCGDRVVGENSDAGPLPDGSVDTDGTSDGGLDTDSIDDGDLTGTWAMLLNATIIQTGIPILNSQWVASRNWYLVELVSDGNGGFSTREKLCAIRIKLETTINKSVAPQAFIDSVAVLERHITPPSTEPGAPWRTDVVYEVRGANLCDIENDPLPPNGSAENDDATPCDQACTGSHCDQDLDGHPGMTNILNGALNCEVYVVLRWWSRLDGAIVDNRTIAGSVTDYFSEQHVLAATADICESGDPGTLDPECPQQQYFKMVKIAPGSTCADVLSLTRCAGPGADEENCDIEGPNDPNALALDPNPDKPDDCLSH